MVKERKWKNKRKIEKKRENARQRYKLLQALFLSPFFRQQLNREKIVSTFFPFFYSYIAQETVRIFFKQEKRTKKEKYRKKMREKSLVYGTLETIRIKEESV